MKKITLFFAIIGMIMLNACTNEGPQGAPGKNGQNGELAEVFELKNVNFSFSNNQYSIYRALNPQIFASDNLLIYRLSGTINSTTPIWQLIPRTLFLPQGELDYDFDFSKQDFTIYAGGNYNLALTPSYLNSQTFRIVIIPGAFSNKMASVEDFSNYEAVIAKYKINENAIKQL